MFNDVPKQRLLSFVGDMLLLMMLTLTTTTSGDTYNTRVKVVTVEGTFQQAIDTCQGWGEGWSLIGPRSVDEDKLVYNRMVKELADSNLNSVWITVRQYSLDGWQNVNGNTYDAEIQLAQKKNNMCSLLKLRYEALTDETCNSQGEGYICQIEDCTHCPYDISPRNCLKLENKCYVFGCDVGGWYDARNMCSRQGFSIISMETKSRLQHIVNWLNKRQRNTCTNFWVGLRKASWHYNAIKASHEANPTFWYKGEPKPESRCAVLQRYNEGYYWKSVSCEEKHSFICALDVIRTTESTIEYSSSRLRQNVQTRTSGNAQQLSRFNRTTSITNPCEGLFTLSVTTLLAIVLTSVIMLLIGCGRILSKRKVKKYIEGPASLNRYQHNLQKSNHV